jgi:hypothetical protein
VAHEPYRSVQIEPGKWYALLDYDRSECCDCGCVHVDEFKLENGRIFYRTRVDRRQTAIQRKKYGITITRSTLT